MTEQTAEFEGGVKADLAWIKDSLCKMEAKYSAKWVENAMKCFIGAICLSVLTGLLSLVVSGSVSALIIK